MRAILDLLVGTLIMMLLVPDSNTEQTTTRTSSVPNITPSTAAVFSKQTETALTTQPSTQTQPANTTTLQTNNSMPSTTTSRATSTGASATSPSSAPPVIPQTTSAPSGTQTQVIAIVLSLIIAVALIVLCVHKVVTDRRAGRVNTLARLLLAARERARSVLGALEGRLGIRLCPGGGGRGEEEEDEEEGQGKEKDVEAAPGGESNGEEKAGDGGDEDSDTSSDYSSLEGVALRERAVEQKEEEEEEEEEGKEEGEEKRSDVSGQAGEQSDTEGEEEEAEEEGTADKDGGAEEEEEVGGAEGESAPLITASSPSENDERDDGDSLDVTAL